MYKERLGRWEVVRELITLLENYWIVKEENMETYYQVKDAIPSFREFLEDKLGYRTVITPDVIKLEKLPGKAEPWMGIDGFKSQLEYGLLCLLLVFLEDRGAGEQFVLSEVTEFIEGNWPLGEKIDWTLFIHRRALVKVMKFAADISLVRVDDGDESGFINSLETEVLYESTGLSRYFVRNFSGYVLKYESWQDIEKGEWLDMDRDRGRVRRNRVYRRLMLSPVVYSEGSEDADYDYIKRYRGMLGNEMQQFLGAELNVHKNGAYLMVSDSMFRDVLPGAKAVSDIALQVNGIIGGMIKNGDIQKGPEDVAVVSKARFMGIIEKCRDKFMQGWSREFRDMGIMQLCEEVIEYMKGFGFIEETNSDREIRIMPLTGRIRGSYPDGFFEKLEKMEEVLDE